jgi:hypothetical protein
MAIDSYMNLQLENTEEYINEEFAGNLGTNVYLNINMNAYVYISYLRYNLCVYVYKYIYIYIYI